MSRNKYTHPSCPTLGRPLSVCFLNPRGHCGKCSPEIGGRALPVNAEHRASVIPRPIVSSLMCLGRIGAPTDMADCWLYPGTIVCFNGPLSWRIQVNGKRKQKKSHSEIHFKLFASPLFSIASHIHHQNPFPFDDDPVVENCGRSTHQIIFTTIVSKGFENFNLPFNRLKIAVIASP